MQIHGIRKIMKDQIITDSAYNQNITDRSITRKIQFRSLQINMICK